MSRKGWRILLGSVAVSGLLFLGASAFFHDLVVIAGSKIRFVLRGRDPAPTSVFEKEYDYTVYPNGEIVAYPMTSGEYLGGPVGRERWSWDGNVITRRELKDAGREPPEEPIVTFTRHDWKD